MIWCPVKNLGNFFNLRTCEWKACSAGSPSLKKSKIFMQPYRAWFIYRSLSKSLFLANETQACKRCGKELSIQRAKWGSSHASLATRTAADATQWGPARATTNIFGWKTPVYKRKQINSVASWPRATSTDALTLQNRNKIIKLSFWNQTNILS